MAEGPRMNKEPEFLAAKLRRVQDPHVRPLNGLVERWRQEGRQVPYADLDSGGIRSRILFLHESPGPQASPGHGSGLISTDNDDPSAERFWRLSREAGLLRDGYISWNAVPWYVSATATNVNAKDADGQAALPYLHEFVTDKVRSLDTQACGRVTTHLLQPHEPPRWPVTRMLPNGGAEGDDHHG